VSQFLQYPSRWPPCTHPGIYDANILGDPEENVQIILLDTHYFRDDLVHSTLTAQEKKTALL
jgi:hypothetical protein